MAAVAVLSAVLSSAPASADPPKRPVPDYDGRGEPRATVGDVFVWGARGLFFPFWLVSEYVIRVPIGAAISAAEEAHVPAALYDFFAFGPDHKAGIVPLGFVDFGFRPSAGLYLFWDDAFAKGHDVRLKATTGGSDWLAGSFTDRVHFGEQDTLTFKVSAIRRPDYAYFGQGPRTLQSSLSRYGADRFDVSTTFSLWPAKVVQLETAIGVRAYSFRSGERDDDPPIDERVRAGTFAQPDGFVRGYRAGYSRTRLVLDSRRVDAEQGTGVRFETQGELGGDPRPAQSWLRYGATVGGFYDLNNHGRVVGLSLATVFSDPLSSGGVPFTELATVGGSNLMRGFFPGRMVDRSAAVATLRYHWPVWMWLDGSIQTSLGNAFGAHLDDFKPGLLRWSGSVGLQTHGSADNALEFLVGCGSETFDQGAKIDSFRLVLGTTGGF